jgi:hypothetical protein
VCSLTREGTRIDSLSKLPVQIYITNAIRTERNTAAQEEVASTVDQDTSAGSVSEISTRPSEKFAGDVRTALDRFIHSCLLGKAHRGPANISSTHSDLKIFGISISSTSLLQCCAQNMHQCASELHGLIRSAWTTRVRRKTTRRSEGETEELICR